MLPVLLAVGSKVLLYSLLLLLGLWCWYQLTYWKILRAAAKLPTPLRPLPVIGHAHYTLFGFEKITQLILDECEDMISKGWSACCLWIGPLPIIVLFNAEDIEKVLTISSTAEKMEEYKFLKFALGNGLLTVPWNMWKVSRRHINPLFHPRNLEHMIPTFNRNSRELLTVLSEHVGATPVNVFPHTMDTALQSVCHLIFGSDVEFIKKSKGFQGLREAVERIPQIFMSRLLLLWLRVESLFQLLYKQELQEINNKWKRFTEDPLKIADMLAVLLAVGSKVLLYSLLLLLGLWCWYQLTYWKILRAAAKLPTPLRPLPVIGHAHYTLCGFEKITQLILHECEDIISKDWSACCLWFGPLPIIVLFNAKDIEKVLTISSTAEKIEEYKFLKFALGNGLLTVPWNMWKVTRRHMDPLFHPRNLEHMIPKFNRNSRELLTVLSEHVGATPVNVFPHTMDTALQSVCHLIFGSDVEVIKKSEGFQGLKEAVERIPQIFMSRLLLLWLRVESLFQLLYKQELQEINNKWKRFTEDPLKMLNLLDVYKLLQKNYPEFTDNDLKHEMITLYATGTDTVGQSVASCLLALAYHPNMQERVFQEIMSVVGQDDDVSSQDLIRMPYLDQVYKETLRFFMIVPFVGRKTTEDIQLGTHFIPAGCTLFIALMALNMNSKKFPKPKMFDPDHFSPENLEETREYSYFPYSGGPRSCIGKRYADILLKIMVVHVLRRYKLTTKMDIYNMKKKLSITLICTEGYNISLETRN